MLASSPEGGANASSRGSAWSHITLPRASVASPFGSNNNDHRQWRMQGLVVGAAASEAQVQYLARSDCWVPQPGRWHPAGMTERVKCSWLPYYRPCSFASQPFDWFADSSVFNVAFYTKIIRLFFFFNNPKPSLASCTKAAVFV